MNSITIIGCGNIGSAIASAILTNKVVKNNELVIVETFSNQHTAHFAEIGCSVHSEISELGSSSDIYILAVKPQNAPLMYRDLASNISQESLIISVMAGVSTAELSGALGSKNIVRSMPNTPCAILQGMTVYFASKSVTDLMVDRTETILGALGKFTQVRDEKLMDAATAISGTGPAYIFYLAEALMEGAMEMGFDHDQSKLLANQTILGAAGLLMRSDYTPEELRKQVTSPGGTTEAAMKLYQKEKLKGKMIDGYQAAFKRSIELGGMKN